MTHPSDCGTSTYCLFLYLSSLMSAGTWDWYRWLPIIQAEWPAFMCTIAWFYDSWNYFANAPAHTIFAQAMIRSWQWDTQHPVPHSLSTTHVPTLSNHHIAFCDAAMFLPIHFVGIIPTRLVWNTSLNPSEHPYSPTALHSSQSQTSLKRETS